MVHDDFFMVWMWTKLPRPTGFSFPPEIVSRSDLVIFDPAVLNLAEQLGHTFFTIFFKKGIAKGVVSWFASNVANVKQWWHNETSVFFVDIKQLSD